MTLATFANFISKLGYRQLKAQARTRSMSSSDPQQTQAPMKARK